VVAWKFLAGHAPKWSDATLSFVKQGGVDGELIVAARFQRAED
jgi:hypothetical protein